MMRGRSGDYLAKRLAVAVFATGLCAASTLVATDAAAVTFTPVKPKVCGGPNDWTLIPFDFNVNSARWDLPQDPYCSGANCPRYIDNLSNNTRIVGNAWTTALYVHFDGFDLETNFDNVFYGANTWTGNMGPFWAFWQVPGGASMLGTYSRLTLFTDRSIGRTTGISTDQVSLCTTRVSAETGKTPVITNSYDRTTGFLLGTNDVIYLSEVMVPSTHHSFALWSNVPGVDFDLYARCGALPTPTTYDYRSYSGDANEFIHYKTACASTIYLAVSSFRGAGAFNLTTNLHSSQYDRSLAAGVGYDASDSELAAYADALRKGARLFYAETEGNWLIENIYLYDNTNRVTSNSAECDTCGGANCNICFSPSGGRPSASCGVGVTMRGNNADEPRFVAHELGHYLLCVGDEYFQPATGSSQFQCGHSNMASPYDENFNHCTDFDHGFDADPAAPSTGLPDVWDTGVGLISGGQERTFDNFSYLNFDFESQVGNVAVFQ
jgi:hypothetical protein